jgi:hypothetical protein
MDRLAHHAAVLYLASRASDIQDSPGCSAQE